MRALLNDAPRQSFPSSSDENSGGRAGGGQADSFAWCRPRRMTRCAVGRSAHAVILWAIAATVSLLVSARTVPAGPGPCVEDPAGVVTCTGDQSAGVIKSPPPVVLKVVNLSANIAPTSGLPGIKFFSQGANGHNGSSGPGSGGDGGSGSNGIGLTTIFSEGLWKIVTEGNAAHGIQAQGLGGNGGDGGNSTCLKLFGVCVAGPLTGIAGGGGKGGDGGTVSVNSDGPLITNGDNAHGVFALSRGGDGGDGGDVENVGGGDAGEGGKAGSGGQVTISSSSVITTHGASSHGIFAQSQGGLGGDGGEVGGIIGKGGAGKDAGHGGKIEVNNFETITTHGADSRGIFAQSVGGFDKETGGGGGGGGTGLFVIGGGAGSGGAGGGVTVTNRGSIETQGAGASAILAESIGGGGGSGGSAIGAGPFTSFAWGGKGGAGGNGGAVTVDSRDSTIDTAGDNAFGLQASSIGGGGGNGGFAVSVAAGDQFAVSFAKGGSGERGGDAGTVTVLGNSTITTQGRNAPGISAESVGGGGGSGGSSIAFAGSKGFSLGISVGGDGAEGGAGGAVTVGNKLDPISGSITSSGDDSSGIHAMSIGGGGGSGGSSISAAVSITGPAAAALSVGGGGGDGGTGGAVTVVSRADITTEGKNSHGIRAQSTSDGGGDGGFALAGAGSFGGAPKNFSVAVGGSGGRGGTAGAVEVASEGLLKTKGDESHGIYATSIGGGGGAGGASISTAAGFGGSSTWNVSTSIGGEGGEGGAGGNVRVGSFEAPVGGSITTQGNDAHGIFAQSIGGGGGQGGSSVLFTFDTALQLKEKNTTVTLTGALGGKGGKGNVGGNVDVTNGSAIRTRGDISHGIFAQSIGGGGGRGGSAEAFNLSTSSLLALGGLNTENWGFNLSAGGDGGDADRGGNVEVVNRGSITTEGALSRGILVQSIGGGGGSVADGISGEVGRWTDVAGNILSALDIAETLYEAFKDPTALIPTSVSLTVGARGGKSADAGNISVVNTGDITTKGLEAHGIFAQSIGGGGGEAQAYAKGKGRGENVDVAIGLLGELAIGGAGGAAGNGGTVTITHSGNIATRGNAAHGIYAQSIGGGGGQAGSVAGGFSDWDAIGLGVAYRRDGGTGGNGGPVTVKSSGDITTHGAGAIGIFAQSIGGGGGVLGDKGGIAFAGSVGGDGRGGEVEVTHTGAITTFGDAAHGIFAQSAGGLDVGGYVTITLQGDVTVQGSDADGLVAQSVGTAGAGNIDITLRSGTAQGGSAAGAAVRMLGGATNTLTNYGTITSKDGVTGNAVISTSGNETINNYGTITGSVQLGSGANAFTNYTGAVLNAGTAVELGAGNTLTNAGTLSPGGSGAPLATVLNGNLVQSGSGVLEVEVFRGGDHDTLFVNGGATSLDGTLLVRRGPGPYRHGTTYEVLGASGGLGGTFAEVRSPEARPLLRFDVTQSANTVDVQVYAPRVTTVATNPVYQRIAAHLDSLLPSASGDLADVLGEFQALPANGFDRAFASLGPMPYDSLTQATVGSTRLSIQSLQRRLDTVRILQRTAGAGAPAGPVLLAAAETDTTLVPILGTYRLSQTQARQGLWLSGFGQWGDQESTPGYTGFTASTGGVTLGYDHTFGDHVAVGLSVGYSNTDVDLAANQGGGRIQGLFPSVYASYFTRTAYVEGALSYGHNWYKNTRNLVIGGLQRTAQSEHDGNAFAAYLGAGYAHPFGDWALGPVGALQYVYLAEEDFQETGAGSVNLSVDPRQTHALVSELGLRATGTIPTAAGTLIPDLSLLWSYDFDVDDRLVTTTYAGAPGVAFSIAGQPVAKNGLLIRPGLTFVHPSGWSTLLRYVGEFRDDYQSHAVLGEVRVQF